MPAGDPAGYLPSVKKARGYVPRARRNAKRVAKGFVPASARGGKRFVSPLKPGSVRGVGGPKDSITKARMRDLQRQYKAKR